MSMIKGTLGAMLKDEFPIFKNNARRDKNGKILPFVYLDSAVSAQKPQSVIDSMNHYMSFDYGSVHRGAYGVSVRSTSMYEGAREKIAGFIGSQVLPDQIVFTKGTTESLNILANGISQSYLDSNSRIVIPMMEHHSNLVPWQQAALRSDCEIAYIPLVGKQKNQLKLNLDEARKQISKNTKVVSLAFMGNVLGQINPISDLIQMAKKVGALVVLDCAQSVSYLDDDLFAMGADAVTFSGHKLYGPSGVGVLALSPELMDRMPPLLFGGGMISTVSLEESTWAKGPSKFEGGTPPISEVCGLSAAIDWVQKIGRRNIHTHSSHLASLFLEKLKSFDDIDTYSSETGHETLVSFRHKKIHAHDLATILDSFNVAMRGGHHCAMPLMNFLDLDATVRCSFGAYSDETDVEIALQAIKDSAKII